MSLTYSTIERMILDAMKGAPTTAPSRTDHFKSRTRAEAPMRRMDSDSSLDSHTDCEASDPLWLGVDSEDIASCEESDGVTEMALISESFKKSSDQAIVPPTSTATALNQSSEGLDSSGASSQDATLSVVRERTLEEKSLGEPKSKRPEKLRRHRSEESQ